MKDIYDSLTILLLLKDRSELTYRWMDYANMIEIPFKVIIADGGKDKTIENTLLDRTNYPHVNYEYLRYPYDKTYPDYFNKVVSSLSNISSKYVVLASNDDFFIVDGLVKSVKFLLENSEYSSCRGEIGGLFYRDWNDYDFRVPSRVLYDIDDKIASVRIKKHLEYYQDLWYAVQTTQVLKSCFETLQELNPSDLYLSEIHTSCLTVASGKVRLGNYMYLIRQQNSSGSNALALGGNNYYLGRILTTPSWSGDYSNFLNNTARMMSSTSDTLEDNIDIVSNGYKKCVSKHIIKESIQNMSPTVRFLINNVLRLNVDGYGGYRRYFYRKIYSVLFRVKYKDGNVSQLGRLLWFYNDVTAIAKVLRKP